MPLTDDLYREIILEHFKNPRNHGVLENASLTAQGANPFCGDELEVTLLLRHEVIQEIRFQGKGCSISQASASMMTEAVKGKSIPDVEQMAKLFKGVMLEGGLRGDDLPPDLEDAKALEGVKKYPVRIKCAILSWNTLLDGLEAHRKGKHSAAHVEGEEGAHPDLTQSLTSEAPPAPSTAASASAVGAGDPKEEVQAALKSVIDPELNMNVVDLGLIYGVEIQGSTVKVTYTLTSPGCPLGPIIKGQIQSSLLKSPWVKEVQAELVWSPPWDPHTMASEEAKTELGIW